MFPESHRMFPELHRMFLESLGDQIQQTEGNQAQAQQQPLFLTAEHREQHSSQQVSQSGPGM